VSADASKILAFCARLAVTSTAVCLAAKASPPHHREGLAHALTRAFEMRSMRIGLTIVSTHMPAPSPHGERRSRNRGGIKMTKQNMTKQTGRLELESNEA
jgi:hypothetical protein